MPIWTAGAVNGTAISECEVADVLICIRQDSSLGFGKLGQLLDELWRLRVNPCIDLSSKENHDYPKTIHIDKQRHWR